MLEILVIKSKVCNPIEMLSMQINVEFALGGKNDIGGKMDCFWGRIILLHKSCLNIVEIFAENMKLYIFTKIKIPNNYWFKKLERWYFDFHLFPSDHFQQIFVLLKFYHHKHHKK